MADNSAPEAVLRSRSSTHETTATDPGHAPDGDGDSTADNEAALRQETLTVADILPPPKDRLGTNKWRWNMSGDRRIHDINYCARSPMRLYKLKDASSAANAARPFASSILGVFLTKGVKADQLEAQPDGSPDFDIEQTTKQIIARHWNRFWLPFFPQDADIPYVVLGIMRKNQSCSEAMIRVDTPESLFKKMRQASSHLRPFPVKMLSLKRVVGFTLYECDPINGSHKTVKLTPRTRAALRDLWSSYRQNRIDYDDRWLNWVHENLNNNSNLTTDGKLALGLDLEWSPFKLAVWGMTPFFLSLAIGFWYSFTAHGTADQVTIVQTGWTISSYIVSGGALILGVLAAITQLGHP